MIVGCVKEIKQAEYRVALIPSHVREYIRHGHQVIVETGLGDGCGLGDELYSEAGATIVDASQVWQQADLLLKVKEPLPSEYKYLRPGLILFTYLHLADNLSLTEALLSRGVSAFAYETVTDNQGFLPLLRPMSEIAGRLSVKEGEKYLQRHFGGKGKLLSGVSGVRPGRVVIIGTGVVAYNACKTALAAGALVSVLGIESARLNFFEDAFAGMGITTLMNHEENLVQELKTADVVIGSVLVQGSKAPKVVRREHLKIMEPGTVLVDVSIDQGGCFETSHPTTHQDPTYIVDGIVHYCVSNMPGAVARTATDSLANETLSYGLILADDGVDSVLNHMSLRNGLNTHGGAVTNINVATSLGLEFFEYENCVKVVKS